MNLADTVPFGFYRLRYLRVLFYLSDRTSVRGNSVVQVHFADLDKPVEAHLDVWCPAELFCSARQGDVGGILCVENLKTPLGTLSRARLRTSDILAVEIDQS